MEQGRMPTADERSQIRRALQMTRNATAGYALLWALVVTGFNGALGQALSSGVRDRSFLILAVGLAADLVFCLFLARLLRRFTRLRYRDIALEPVMGVLGRRLRGGGPLDPPSVYVGGYAVQVLPHLQDWVREHAPATPRVVAEIYRLPEARQSYLVSVRLPAAQTGG